MLVNRIANLVRYGQAYHSPFVNSQLSPEDVEACKAFLLAGELPDSLRAKLAVAPCPGWRVMAITFTNKAAGELKERLARMLGPQGEEVWAATFHSSCARMLRRDGDRLGYTSHFTIYDTDDSRRLMKAVLKDLDIPERALSVRGALSEISRAKDRLLSPQAFAQSAGDDFRLKKVAQAYDLYQRRLADADAMDFDDLLVNTVRLFEECPDVLEYYQNRFRYLMVDEYQDTNHAQYRFVSLLAQKSGNLCVVGDDDQSIYKFRGATIENILHFEEDFPGAQVVRLEQNYRSTQNILDAANAVIAHNQERKGKTLWTAQGPGKKIGLHLALNEQDEADAIAKAILDGVAKGRKFSDFAVLYRMNSQSQALERMFAKQGIPHRIIGGTRFFDRKEVRDMIAYLSVINNPADEIRLRRIVNVPRRGIGERTVDLAAEIGQQEGESLFQVLTHPKDFPAIARAASKTAPFAALMEEFVEKNRAGELLPSQLYGQLVERLAYEDYLKQDDPERAEERLENVQELSSMLRRYEEEAGEEASLSGFLEEVSLFTDIDNYDQGGGLCRDDDGPLRQGAGVPGGVPPRLGGGGVPGHGGALRPRAGGGGAPPGLCGHHPGPGGAYDPPRGEPDDLWHHQPQPAVPVCGGDSPGAVGAEPVPPVEQARPWHGGAPGRGKPPPYPVQGPGGVQAPSGEARPGGDLPGGGQGVPQDLWRGDDSLCHANGQRHPVGDRL